MIIDDSIIVMSAFFIPIFICAFCVLSYQWGRLQIRKNIEELVWADIRQSVNDSLWDQLRESWNKEEKPVG